MASASFVAAEASGWESLFSLMVAGVLALNAADAGGGVGED